MSFSFSGLAMNNIEVNIDRLVLDGISVVRRDRPLLQTAVETELARLLGEGGLDRQTNIALRDVPSGQIQLSQDSDPGQLGRQIAQSVYSSMNR